MRKIVVFLLVCIVALATGCPKSTPKKPGIITDRVINYHLAQYDRDLRNYECLTKGEIFNSERLTFDGCNVDIDTDKARQLRNELTYKLIRMVDYNYFEFENDLYVKRASGSFLADVIDTGANFAGAITNGERAKTIINAAIIAFRGGRKSASIQYFQEQTADVLITKMQTARNRILADMIEQLKTNNITEYPLDAALGDIIKYFYAGTLPRALQELREDANVASREAKNAVRDVKGLAEPGLVTKARRATSREAFKVLGSLEAALTEDDQAEDALKKLQDIVKELEKDAALKRDLQGQDVSSETDDGQQIIDALREIKEQKSDNADDASISKINDAIVKFGKPTEEEDN